MCLPIEYRRPLLVDDPAFHPTQVDRVDQEDRELHLHPIDQPDLRHTNVNSFHYIYTVNS